MASIPTLDVLAEKATRTDRRLSDHDERISSSEKTLIQIASDIRASRWIIGTMIAMSTVFLAVLKFIGAE